MRSSEAVLAPLLAGATDEDGNAVATDRIAQRISNAASAGTATALTVGKYGSLICETDTYIAFAKSAAPTVTASNGIFVPAGGRYDWYVEGVTKFVGALAKTGTSSVQVWRSSP